MNLFRVLIYYDVGDWLVLAEQHWKSPHQARQDLIAIIHYHLYREYYILSGCTSLTHHQQQLFVRLQSNIRTQLAFIGFQSMQRHLPFCECTITSNADLCVDLFTTRTDDATTICTQSNP